MGVFRLRETGVQIQNLLSGIRGMTGVLQRGGETVYRAATAADLQAVGYTAQTLSEQQKAQARENIGVGTEGGGVFVATLGETTSAEIEAAYQAGKDILVESNGNVGRLTLRSSATAHIFSSPGRNNQNQIQTVTFVCNNNNWTTNTYGAEKAIFKVTSIDASSTDLQYPSAKAVYDFAPVLTAPDGSKWQLNVSNSGAVSSTKVT